MTALGVEPIANWQMTPKTAFDLRNKTGSEMFIQASTMAGAEGPETGYSAAVPVQAPAQASHPSLTGAKFDRQWPRQATYCVRVRHRPEVHHPATGSLPLQMGPER